MDGLMMDRPLLVKQIAERAEAVFGHREVVARTQEGVERSTYGRVVERARRLASALAGLGVGPGDRVASFAWNSLRHLELYLAVPSMGAVLHTLNIRLFEQDLRYIVEHADDRLIFLDASLASAMPRFEGTEREVLMPDGPGERPGALDYEELVASGDPAFEFPDLDENTAAAMCYTSGTTGRPKGVLYSHRSIVLHTLGAALPDSMGIREADSVMPVVPMFHAMAWGIPYIAAMLGARQVLPGPDLTPQGLAELIAAEGVTLERRRADDLERLPGARPAARPLQPAGAQGGRLSRSRAHDPRLPGALRGAAGPGLGNDRDQPAGRRLSPARRRRALRRRGLRAASQPGPRPAAGRVSHRSRSAGGELQVRGPWIARAYYRDPSGDEKFTEDGWLRTGDVAELRRDAFIRLVDRTKDLVKSGGEWISSVELENAIMAHPDVVEAAVIAVPDERWGERPCACVVRRAGVTLDADGLRAHLDERVAQWWIPERVEFIDEVPKTSVGKFDKKLLRARFAGSEAAVGSESR